MIYELLLLTKFLFLFSTPDLFPINRILDLLPIESIKHGSEHSVHSLHFAQDDNLHSDSGLHRPLIILKPGLHRHPEVKNPSKSFVELKFSHVLRSELLIHPVKISFFPHFFHKIEFIPQWHKRSGSTFFRHSAT